VGSKRTVASDYKPWLQESDCILTAREKSLPLWRYERQAVPMADRLKKVLGGGKGKEKASEDSGSSSKIPGGLDQGQLADLLRDMTAGGEVRWHS
jgi:hypothetical protein